MTNDVKPEGNSREQEDLSGVYDKFAKSFLFQERYFRSFLKLRIDKEELAHINLSKLKLVNAEKIVKGLRRKIADIVYETEIDRKPGVLVLHLEHKSSPDPATGVQLFVDKALIVEHYWRHLRFPVPTKAVVVHDGKSPWSRGCSFHEMYKIDGEMKKYFADFPIDVVDYASIDDVDEKLDSNFAAFELILQKMHSRDIIEVKSMIERATILSSKDFRRNDFLNIYELLRKVLPITPEELAEVMMPNLSEETIKDFKSVEDQWLERGIERGIERGVEIGVTKGMVKLLELRFTEKFGIPDEDVKMRFESLKSEEQFLHALDLIENSSDLDSFHKSFGDIRI
ncbi:MAG: Rpn family recombination-promoting nuclease/putative transposase [Planctomycetes bacterium]|nr:Rpn family recombination-promoting nuclease/putative transposase [Planctomycetota bacterium]